MDLGFEFMICEACWYMRWPDWRWGQGSIHVYWLVLVLNFKFRGRNSLRRGECETLYFFFIIGKWVFNPFNEGHKGRFALLKKKKDLIGHRDQSIKERGIVLLPPLVPFSLTSLFTISQPLAPADLPITSCSFLPLSLPSAPSLSLSSTSLPSYDC